jgi:hypothetical protein
LSPVIGELGNGTEGAGGIGLFGPFIYTQKCLNKTPPKLLKLGCRIKYAL